MLLCVFFFKQKTAYEMRISDWISDVCSSDLWILAEKRGAAGLITINRPDVFNAWDRDMLLRTEEVLSAFERDTDVHAIILTGAGEKAFLAGGEDRKSTRLNSSH